MRRFGRSFPISRIISRLVKTDNYNKKRVKVISGGVLFLTATTAQTQDALHVIRELDPDLAIALIAIFPMGYQTVNMIDPNLDGVRRRGPVRAFCLSWHLPKSVNQLLQIFAVRRHMKKFKSEFASCIMVVGDDICPVERAAIEYAKKLSVKSVLIQDGILIDPISELAFFKTMRSKAVGRKIIRRILRFGGILPELTAYGASSCDIFAVWGESTQKMMIDFGIRPEKISLVGSPRMDQWIKMRTSSDLRTPLGLKIRLLFISLLFSNMKDETYVNDYQMMMTLETLMEQDSRLEITVRPHPSEKIKSYHRLFNTLNIKRLRLDNESALQAALFDCDLILTYCSTIAIEGMILNKPVIFLPMDDKWQSQIFDHEGAAVSIKELKDLKYWIYVLLQDEKINQQYAEKRREFLGKLLGVLDEESSDRAARLIERTLKIGGD
jgi:hypothetical protein